MGAKNPVEKQGAIIHHLKMVIASISALRAAFGGCAPNRSPAGECAEKPLAGS